MTLVFVIYIKIFSLSLLSIEQITSLFFNHDQYSLIVRWIDRPWLFAWIQDEDDKTNRWNYYCLNESDRNIVYIFIYERHQSDQWILNLFNVEKKNISISENKNSTTIYVVRFLFANDHFFSRKFKSRSILMNEENKNSNYSLIKLLLVILSFSCYTCERNEISFRSIFYMHRWHRVPTKR